MSPQDKDQPMNPDDTLQASEEVGVEGEEANPARGLLSPTQPRTKKKSRTRFDASASPIVVWTLSEGVENEPSAISQQDDGGACCADCVN